MADFSVGEIAVRAGVKVSALHFYEQKNLIQSHRNAGNQRRYSKTVLRRIAVIKMAQNLGYSLQEIASMLSLLSHDKVAKDDWQRLSQQWQQDLERRIEAMFKLKDELEQCIGCGCLSLEDCRLRNPEDKLGQHAQGAVLWSTNNDTPSQ